MVNLVEGISHRRTHPRMGFGGSTHNVLFNKTVTTTKEKIQALQ